MSVLQQSGMGTPRCHFEALTFNPAHAGAPLSKIEETLSQITSAGSWDERVQAIRRIPELHGKQEHQAVYAAVAQALYRRELSPQIAFVAWRNEYEFDHFAAAYQKASALTSGFTRVATEDLEEAFRQAPECLLAFRTIVGYTPGELAVAAASVAADLEVRALSGQRIKTIEGGSRCSVPEASVCALTIHRLVSGELWGDAPAGFRSKLDKYDTASGWVSVREAARSGVPYEVYLHQRRVGGSFLQLLNATSSRRGDLLEAPVETLLLSSGVPYIRTGTSNQGEIVRRFNLTVRPAPDFVIFEEPNTLKAMIECKQTNDGGTARDKAARYGRLRGEAMRLGGVALFAVLDGLGWQRLNDALGPVVRHCDGRIFTLRTLPQMLEVQPFPALAGKI